MINVEEMKELLRLEFGIKTEKELDEALKKNGGIKIGVFVTKPADKKSTNKASCTTQAEAVC